MALENLSIIEREGMIENVRSGVGPYFLKRLKDTVAEHPIVGEARAFGLMGAIEIVKNKETRERFHGDLEAGVAVRNHAIANGMMMRAVGDTMILSPPLMWTNETVDLAISRIMKALDLAERDLRK